MTEEDTNNPPKIINVKAYIFEGNPPTNEDGSVDFTKAKEVREEIIE